MFFIKICLLTKITELSINTDLQENEPIPFLRETLQLK